MLLAEANQWPEDAVAYFGQGRGDECHMAYHFPLMPRLFMAVRMEDRQPIVDILEQTPPIPETSQWALFLRNHDELTLEMVTDEERDYMYRMYAHVEQARLNLGIRRRLAPLMNNDRKSIELLNALLFSLPGTPVLYYGDEIGLGENILSGRPQRRAHADAMESGQKRRLLPRQSAEPLSADHSRPGIPLRSRQRGSAIGQSALAAVVDAAVAGACGNDGARWARGNVSFSNPKTARFSATSSAHESETLLVVANLSRFRAAGRTGLVGLPNRACPSNCLAGRNSRSSPSGLISCRLARTPFIGFRSRTNWSRQPSSRFPVCGLSFQPLRSDGNGTGSLTKRTRPGWKPSFRPT